MKRIGTCPQFSWGAVVLAVLVTLVLGVSFARHFDLAPVDDAFISLRYATNWARGAGLAFNPGEVVEGYTNFLEVAVLAVAIKTEVEPVLAMTSIGWVSLGLLAGIFTAFTLRHLVPGRPLVAATMGVVAMLNPVLLSWASSGMESLLYAALLLATAAAILEDASRRRTVLAAILLVLAAMTRPEAVALLPIFAAMDYVRSRSRRRTGLFLGVFLAAYGTYFVVRWIHFGALLPNTFYAKLDYGNIELWQRGANYVGDFFAATPLLGIAAFVALLPFRRWPNWLTLFVVLVVGQTLIVVYEGGDHFAMFRFMVPVLPFLTAMALHTCVVISGRIQRRDLSTALLVVMCLVVIGIPGLRVGRQLRHDKEPLRSQFEWHRFEVRLAHEWSLVGRWMGRHLPPGSSVVVLPIGAIGFYSGLTVLDPVGIVDPVIARQDRELGRGYAGHEKYDIDYLLSRDPDYILLLDVATSEPVPLAALAHEMWGEANHALLRHPALARDYRYENVPMGPLYLNIHVRRDLPPL